MSNSDKELDEILHDLIERASNTTAVNLHDHNLTPEAKQRLNALIEKKVRAILEALTPTCCHTSGMHDPTHWKENKSICTLQKAEAFDRVLELLNIKYTPADVPSSKDCWWCNEYYVKDVSKEATRQYPYKGKSLAQLQDNQAKDEK